MTSKSTSTSRDKLIYLFQDNGKERPWVVAVYNENDPDRCTKLYCSKEKDYVKVEDRWGWNNIKWTRLAQSQKIITEEEFALLILTGKKPDERESYV